MGKFITFFFNMKYISNPKLQFILISIVLTGISPVLNILFGLITSLYLVTFKGFRLRQFFNVLLVSLSIWYLMWSISVFPLNEALIIGNTKSSDVELILATNLHSLWLPSLTFQTFYIVDSIVQLLGIEMDISAFSLLSFLNGVTLLP